MRGHIHTFWLLALLTALSACSGSIGDEAPLRITDLGDLQFRQDHWFVEGDTVQVYRSLDYISIMPAKDVEIPDLNRLVEDFSLVPVTRFQQEPMELLTRHYVSTNQPVVFMLPPGSDAEPFWSTSSNGNGFADSPLVKYVLPVYSHRNPFEVGKTPSWFYLSDQIIMHQTGDGEPPTSLIQEFDLEFDGKNVLLDIYTYRLATFDHGCPVTVARKVYLAGDFRYVVPNAWYYITRF